MTGYTLPFYHQRFFDNSGNPLSGGKIYFYVVDSVIPKNIYVDKGLTTPAQNPLTLDSAGICPQFFAVDGAYDIVIKDKNGITIDTPKYIEATSTSGTSSISLSSSGWVYYNSLSGTYSTSSTTLPTATNSGFLYYNISSDEYSYKNLIDDTYKVKCDEFDVVPDYISNKIISSDSNEVVENLGTNRTIQINSLGKVKTNNSDSNDFLSSKFYNSDSVVWNVENNKLVATINLSATDSYKVKTTQIDDTPDYIYTKFISSDNIYVTTNWSTNKISFDLAPRYINNVGRVYSSEGDSTVAATLDTKIITSGGVEKTFITSGSIERMVLSSSGKVASISGDSLGYLSEKIKGGAGITITSATDTNGTKLYINSRTNSWRPITYITSGSSYTVIDTDDTIVNLVGPTVNVYLPKASQQYEGRIITVQGGWTGYTAIVSADSSSIYGSGSTSISGFSKTEFICVSNGSTYIWIAR